MLASRSSAKYSRLRNQEDSAMGEAAFDFGSVFTYEDNPSMNGSNKSIHNYDSVFRYRTLPGESVKIPIMTDSDSNEVSLEPQKPMFWLQMTSWILTFISYAFFVLTIPVSYWMLVHRMGEFERLVVFRLGKMVGVRGPGRFVIFPWMDRTKKIDVRASAFAVPPQQFITCDGGIVEMGAEIQYNVVDVVTMVSEVADHQDILRSLGKTLLVKILVRKTVTQLEKDKRTPEADIMDEINDQVRKWGINVQTVALSECKVLKQADNGSDSAVGSILKGLGMKDEPKYPTPAEFVRASHGLDDKNDPNATTSLLPGGTPLPASAGMGTNASVNMSLLQSLTGAGGMSGTPAGNNSLAAMGASLLGGGAQQQQAAPKPPSGGGTDEYPANWGKCLEIIIQTEFAGGVEDDASGVYKLAITGTVSGTSTYFIEIGPNVKRVTSQDDGFKPDVSVVISSSDLASVLDGSLAPLQAYLTGRITASGDVKKLMFFDKLSRRGHKVGGMFEV